MDNKMKEFVVREVVTTVRGYHVKADSARKAVTKLELQYFAEGDDIARAPEYDKVTDRYAMCDE